MQVPTELASLIGELYCEIESVGAGAQGAVFRAVECEKPFRQVALKWIAGSAKKMAIDEFAHLASVRHESLTTVLALHQSSAGTCIVSEYVEAPEAKARWNTLAEADRPEFLLKLTGELAGALSHLHAQGLVHGDVKPSHILSPESGSPTILLDLGLARSTGPGDCRGTPAYMAPETLSGHLDGQSEVYSLGISLVEIADGRPLISHGPREIFTAILSGVADEARERLTPLLPAPLVDLLAAMLQVDRGKRPSSMASVRSHLQRVAEALGLDLSNSAAVTSLGSEFFGREAEVLELVGQIRNLASGSSCGDSCEIRGATGSGRSRLIREAILRARVVLAAEHIPFPAVRFLCADELGGLTPEALTQAIAAACVGPTLIVAEDVAIRSLRLCAPPDNALLIIEAPNDVVIMPRSIALTPLSAEDSRALCEGMCEHPPNPAWIHRAAEIAQYLPGPLIACMRAAAVLDPRFSGSPDALLRDEEVHAALIERVRTLPPRPAALLEFLSAAGRPLTWQFASGLLGVTPEQLAEPIEILRNGGFIHLSKGCISCVSAAYAAALDDHIPTARRRTLHRRLLAEDTTVPLVHRARHLRITGPNSEAATVALEAIAREGDAGRFRAALRLCEDSASVMRGANASRHALLTAETALAVGNYKQAEEAARRAQRSRAPGIRNGGLRARAKCAQHRGELEQAEALLEELVSAEPQSARARAALAKVLLSRGSLDAARICAEGALSAANHPEENFEALEIVGLSHLYQGSLDACADAFSAMNAIAAEANTDRLRGRGAGLSGMLSQQRSDLAVAAAQYQRAAELSYRSGAVHAAAVFRLNSATVFERLARYGDALESYQNAHSALIRSGTPFELCAAHCNRGNLLLTLGETQSAKVQATTAAQLAERANEPRISYFVELLLGEVAERGHRSSAAKAHYTAALEAADLHALSDRVYACMRLAEWHARAGTGEAKHHLADLPHDSEEHQLKILACTARVALTEGEVNPALIESLASALSSAAQASDLDLHWRLAALLTRSHAALGHNAAAEKSRVEAIEAFANVSRQCPEAYRAGLAGHPEARALAAVPAIVTAPLNTTPAPQPLPLRRLLALSRKLNSEQRIGPLLDEIIDTAVELSSAERAFLLLRDSQGALRLRVARNMSREELGENEKLSTSIAERVAETGQVVMTVDAEADQRFDNSQSVAALQLRSILAVPFRVKDRIVGTLYLDHRFRRSAFDEAAVEVVRELADIAAIAIENARLLRQNLERQDEIRNLNTKLEERLQTTEVKLAQTRAQVPDAQRNGAFEAIIGTSKGMQDLLAIAERAAACALPVVIHGESGTGKELLARAIHAEGDRATAAFVPLNCGAVPDNLLEAELFGYKRGAFTGADRGKRGLFEVADGGTLFLDEIADTSLAMQGKLLRVLQEGEIRPLGAEELRHVDVRILCASNKTLWGEVKAGRFREDLFYRLKVLELEVPPLRNRREDIRTLSAHLLAPGRSLSPGALRALEAHDWPGNIRELENELARAQAMSEDACIAAEQLSASLSQAPSEGGSHPAKMPVTDYALKPKVEALERELVEAAMAHTKGNQSKAAILLGLSRFGLQKKLQRYGISGSRPVGR